MICIFLCSNKKNNFNLIPLLIWNSTFCYICWHIYRLGAIISYFLLYMPSSHVTSPNEHSQSNSLAKNFDCSRSEIMEITSIPGIHNGDLAQTMGIFDWGISESNFWPRPLRISACVISTSSCQSNGNEWKRSVYKMAGEIQNRWGVKSKLLVVGLLIELMSDGDDESEEYDDDSLSRTGFPLTKSISDYTLHTLINITVH